MVIDEKEIIYKFSLYIENYEIKLEVNKLVKEYDDYCNAMYDMIEQELNGLDIFEKDEVLHSIIIESKEYNTKLIDDFIKKYGE